LRRSIALLLAKMNGTNLARPIRMLGRGNERPMLRISATIILGHLSVRRHSYCYFLAWWVTAYARSFIESRSPERPRQPKRILAETRFECRISARENGAFHIFCRSAASWLRPDLVSAPQNRVFRRRRLALVETRFECWVSAPESQASRAALTIRQAIR
jgi:hypothetical protein